MDVDVLRARLRMSLACDVMREAQAVRIPALLLQARHDRLLSPRAFRQLRMALPHAEQVEIDGPHLLLQANPQGALPHVRRSAARLDGQC